MSSFINWAVKQFKTDAQQMGHMPQLLKTLREESDQQWVQRVMPIMDNLQVVYVFETGQALCVYSMEEVAVKIFNELKKELTPNVPQSATPSEKM